MSQDRIIEKIRKCMAMANSANATEVATALRQAQKLMEQYGISDASVALADVNSELVGYGSSSNPAGYMCALASLVGKTFHAEPILSYQDNGEPSFQYIGLNSQPELACYTFNVLRRQLIKARSSYLKTLDKRLKRSTKTRRADFFAIAWVSEVRAAVRVFAQSEEEKELIELYKKETIGCLGTHSPKAHQAKRNDHKAAIAGRKAAEGVNLNHGLNNGGDLLRITA